MNKLICVAMLFCLSFGCQKPGQVEFIDVVKNHRELTDETNTRLLENIARDLEDGASLTEEQQAQVNDLIARLQTMIDQAKVIETYVNNTSITPEILAELLKSKWKGTSE